MKQIRCAPDTRRQWGVGSCHLNDAQVVKQGIFHFPDVCVAVELRRPRLPTFHCLAGLSTVRPEILKADLVVVDPVRPILGLTAPVVSTTLAGELDVAVFRKQALHAVGQKVSRTVGHAAGMICSALCGDVPLPQLIEGFLGFLGHVVVRFIGEGSRQRAAARPRHSRDKKVKIRPQ